MAYTNMSITDTYDALLSSTLRNYRKQLEDNIFHKLPLLYWLNDKGRRKTQDGGYQIMVPLLYGENSTVKFYNKYDVLDVTPQEGMTMARYDWKQLGGSISISRKEERMNSGQHAIFNLLEAKIMQLEETMRWVVNDYLHGRYGSTGKTYCESGNAVDSAGGANVSSGGNEFNSLDHIVRPARGYMDTDTTTARTETCGGIQTSVTTDGGGDTESDYIGVTVTGYTNAWWLPYSIPGFQRIQRGGVPGSMYNTTEVGYAGYITNNSNQNLITTMRTLYNMISDGAESPDIGLTSRSVFETYESALMPLERFTDVKTGDAGFQNLRFKGMTLMFDHGIVTSVPTAAPTAAAPAVPLYMLNSRYLSWVVDSGTDFITTPFQRPPDQDAKVAQVLLMANLTCSNRSKQGVIACANNATTPYAA